MLATHAQAAASILFRSIISTYIGRHLGRNNLVSIVTEVKVQVRKQERLAALDFADQKVFVRRITNIPPHWKIFHKHFKKVIVVNGLLELEHLLLVKSRLAQETPIDTILKGNLVRRRFATVTYNGFTEALTVALSALELFADGRGRLHVDIFFGCGFLLFFFRRVLMAERKRVVTVRFSGVIERSVRVLCVCFVCVCVSNEREREQTVSRPMVQKIFVVCVALFCALCVQSVLRSFDVPNLVHDNVHGIVLGVTLASFDALDLAVDPCQEE